MTKRLSAKEIKHDIREDEVQTFLTRVFLALEEHPRAVSGVLIAILVLVLAFSGALSWLDHRQQAAAGELAAAIETYQAPIVENGAKPDDPDNPSFASAEERRERAKAAFSEIRAGAAGEVAELYLADIALEEGDVETARSIWEDFLDDNGGHLLALSVRLNLIHLDRDQGRAAEVAAELEKELADPRRTLPEDVILFELAETREALGEAEAALDYYQRIVDEHPQSAYLARARQKTTAASS